MESSLHVEDHLYGASKFSAWKTKFVMFLKESELWDIVENIDTNPVIFPTDAMEKVKYDKKNIKD